MDPVEELVRLQVLDLRRRLGTQAEAVIELRQAGFAPTRIAELLGTSSNVVNVTLQKAKKSGKLKATGD
jgi:DNA-directed RNA polymerase specialized sigma24 family protein